VVELIAESLKATTTIRGLPSEVVLEPGDDPTQRHAAVNLDSVESVSVAARVERIGSLSTARLWLWLRTAMRRSSGQAICVGWEGDSAISSHHPDHTRLSVAVTRRTGRTSPLGGSQGLSDLVKKRCMVRQKRGTVVRDNFREQDPRERSSDHQLS